MSAPSVELIETGRFYADGGAMFGCIPKASWTRRYPCKADNACVLAMRSMLINDGNGRIILVDNGVGNKQLRKLRSYNFFDLVDINSELQRRGIAPTDVTDVVLTHLHFDHCGYTTQRDDDGRLKLSFPHARHWITRSQWDICNNPSPLEQSSYLKENIEPLADATGLRLIDSPVDISPAVALKIAGGHADGQIVVYATDADRTYVFAGDVIPLAAHISLAWISAYDLFPLNSYNAKRLILDEAARLHQSLVYCHDAYLPCSTIKKLRKDVYSILK
ncbi:MAG: MBL fold metallo-hydrolase [Tannerellaceae bacterium]|jgi:glyoxylase-like metal-dependent hydrolase (beta-lactamase superfamily II)|nr:MBL fold metallo-hydrolase [Tannerellaceae bacterium]